MRGSVVEQGRRNPVLKGSNSDGFSVLKNGFHQSKREPCSTCLVQKTQLDSGPHVDGFDTLVEDRIEYETIFVIIWVTLRY